MSKRISTRKNYYEEPILLNIETDDEGDNLLRSNIYQMVSGPDFCLLLTEDGKLYAMG